MATRGDFLKRNKGYMRQWVDYFSRPTPEEAKRLWREYGGGVPPCLIIELTRGYLNQARQAHYIKRRHLLGPLKMEPFLSKIRPANEADTWPKTTDQVPSEIVIRLCDFKKQYLRVDVSQKRRYRKELFNLLNEQFANWDTVSKKLGLEEKAQRQRDDAVLDKYLQVWDLVQRMGRKWTKISNIVYPNDVCRKTAQVKVQKHYKQACKLIANAPYSSLSLPKGFLKSLGFVGRRWKQ